MPTSSPKEFLFLSIVMPALNEEKNIQQAVGDTLASFGKFRVTGEVVVINDGSSDNTAELVRALISQYPDKVRMVEHKTPKGMGASFWDGVDAARGNAVCMLPGDNENIPDEIIRYLYLLQDVDMVVPFVFNRKAARSASRILLSSLYLSIVNATFFTNLNYTNGTVLYRRCILAQLQTRCSGFFFQTDILIRLIKRGYLFAEVPYRLRQRKAGRAKAISWRAFKAVVKGYLRLVRDIYFKKDREKGVFCSDSVTYLRYTQNPTA